MRSRNTGDINLAAALMSVGFPLDAEEPACMIESESGRYASFRICEVSLDGSEEAGDVMEYWTSGQSPPDHGMKYVSSFIKARPKHIKSTADILDFAIEYLSQQGCAVFGVRCFDDIPDHVSRFPKTESAYILAFVYNRETCFQLAQNGKRQVYYDSNEGDNSRRTLLDTNLDRRLSRELLSRQQG
jgi:hypothetical protein